MQEGSDIADETIGVVSEKTERQVIGLRKNNEDLIFPDPLIKLESGDKLLVLDKMKKKSNHSIRRSGRKKVVIVDDNPVILRLYTRLFQKAGFHPITASNGREGVDAIIREKPAAAVIDYMLPVLSGIEVCRQVRAAKNSQKIKLILFTADNNVETHKRAVDAGTDAVVIKNSEASEVIEAVVRTLRLNK